MANKTAFQWRNSPDRSALYSRGVKISGFSEMLILGGLADIGLDGRCRHPGDPVGQTRGVLEDLVNMLEDQGWSVKDVVKAEFTLTKEVDLDRDLDRIWEVWAEAFKDAVPKPAGGTLRVSHALARPDVWVEYEVMAVR